MAAFKPLRGRLGFGFGGGGGAFSTDGGGGAALAIGSCCGGLVGTLAFAVIVFSDDEVRGVFVGSEEDGL